MMMMMIVMGSKHSSWLGGWYTVERCRKRGGVERERRVGYDGALRGSRDQDNGCDMSRSFAVRERRDGVKLAFSRSRFARHRPPQ